MDFEEIYSQYSPQIFRVCMGYVNDADQAKDKGYNLRLRIQKNGNITVINERNGYNKTYKAGG